MFKKLFTNFFGYRVGQYVDLGAFDNVENVINSAGFKAFECRKGGFSYWLVIDLDTNCYVVINKYKI